MPAWAQDPVTAAFLALSYVATWALFCLDTCCTEHLNDAASPALQQLRQWCCPCFGKCIGQSVMLGETWR